MRKAPNETLGDRFTDAREYDRDGVGRLPKRQRGRSTAAKNHVRRQSQKLHGSEPRLVEVKDAPAIVDREIATQGPSELLHAPLEYLDASSTAWVILEDKIYPANARYTARLLRSCRERPRGCRAAEQRDELAARHSITSSARPSSGSGTVRPSALAVFILMTSSTFTAF